MPRLDPQNLRVELKSTIATLYKIYNKEEDLLYVGVTTNIEVRLKTHRRTKDWFKDAWRIGRSYHDNLIEARKVEKQIIQEMKPRYNVRHNG